MSDNQRTALVAAIDGVKSIVDRQTGGLANALDRLDYRLSTPGNWQLLPEGDLHKALLAIDAPPLGNPKDRFIDDLLNNRIIGVRNSDHFAKVGNPDAWFAEMALQMADYPARVLEQAVTTLNKKHPWFVTPADFCRVADAIMAERQRLKGKILAQLREHERRQKVAAERKKTAQEAYVDRAAVDEVMSKFRARSMPEGQEV